MGKSKNISDSIRLLLSGLNLGLSCIVYCWVIWWLKAYLANGSYLEQMPKLLSNFYMFLFMKWVHWLTGVPNFFLVTELTRLTESESAELMQAMDMVYLYLPAVLGIAVVIVVIVSMSIASYMLGVRTWGLALAHSVSKYFLPDNDEAAMASENVSSSISEMFDMVIKSLYPSGELTSEHVLYIFSRYVERLRALNLQNPLENSLLEDYCRRMMGLVQEGETSSVVAEVLEGIMETPSTVVEVLPLSVDLLEVPCADVMGEVALQVSEVMPTLLSAAV